MRILAVIVVYNPDMEVLRRNIASFIGGVGKLLVWRNSPVDETAVTEGHEDWTEKVEFCGTGQNVGLPKAYNHAAARASVSSAPSGHLICLNSSSCISPQ